MFSLIGLMRIACYEFVEKASKSQPSHVAVWIVCTAVA